MDNPSKMPIVAAPKPASSTPSPAAKPTSAPAEDKKSSLVLKPIAPYSPGGRGGIMSGAGSNFSSKTAKRFDAIIGA